MPTICEGIKLSLKVSLKYNDMQHQERTKQSVQIKLK